MLVLVAVVGSVVAAAPIPATLGTRVATLRGALTTLSFAQLLVLIAVLGAFVAAAPIATALGQLVATAVAPASRGCTGDASASDARAGDAGTRASRACARRA